MSEEKTRYYLKSNSRGGDWIDVPCTDPEQFYDLDHFILYAKSISGSYIGSGLAIYNKKDDKIKYKVTEVRSAPGNLSTPLPIDVNSNDLLNVVSKIYHMHPNEVLHTMCGILERYGRINVSD